MEIRIVLIGIIVEDMNLIDKINGILYEYFEYMVGRMGIFYREKSVVIISIVIDVINDVISLLFGKLGMIKGINVKIVYFKIGK